MHAKKLIGFLVTLLLILGLAACGKQPDSSSIENSSVNSPTRNSSTTELPEQTTQAPADYPFEPTVTGIYVTRDGRLMSAEVASFDNPHYELSGLQTFVLEQVNAYNDAKGTEAVILNDVKVADGKATLILEYSKFGYFLDFQGSDFGVASLRLMTTAEAAKDYTLNNLAAPNGTTVSAYQAVSDESAMVLAVVGDTSVTVNGDILFLSKNFTVTGVNSARVNTEEPCFIFFK